MRARDLNLHLPEDPDRPRYLQVAAALAEAIAQGRLAPGTALPGVRELARMLGLNRNTVLAALGELKAQGLVESREREGIFVREGAPRTPAAAPGPPTRPGFDLPDHFDPPTEPVPNLLDLSEPMADVRLAPSEALARAYSRALRQQGGGLLARGDARGTLRLREGLSAHLGEARGLVVDPERILITGGVRMGLALVTQVLVGTAGGVVALEDPLRPWIREVLRQAAPVDLVPVPVDAEGMAVEALPGLLGGRTPSLVLVSPACQDPTGTALAPARRQLLLQFAREHRFPVVELELEPAYDRAPSPPPLAAEDPTGQVLHLGGFSRTVAPGFRLGYLTGAGQLVAALAKARQRLDWQGDRVLEWALADLMEEGEYGRHLRRLRRSAEERRAALGRVLVEELGADLLCPASDLGMGLWVQGRGRLAAPPAFQHWLGLALRRGVRAAPGQPWHLDGRPLAATRLAFSAHEPAELKAAAWRLARALEDLQGLV